MIVAEDLINPVLRDIDSLYFKSEISASDAEDLSRCISWIVGKSLNESNVQYVIKSLRGFKTVMDEKSVSGVINSFRSLCGQVMQ